MTEINKCTLSKTKEWFEKAVPNPELKNFNAQLGCHFEEVAEMVSCLAGETSQINYLISNTFAALDRLARYLKENSVRPLVKVSVGDETNFLDAICDQTVTGVGVAYMLGHDIIGAMNEVNDSNFSKFEYGQPLFDANRKIIKGQYYCKPNLEPFLKRE